MKRFWVVVLFMILVIAACGGRPEETATPPPTRGLPTSTPPPSATPMMAETGVPEPGTSHPGRPLPVDAGELFSTSGACAICHNNMTDDSRADVSLDTYWRATMMANAARDPYWLASVRYEVLLNPDLQQTIEEKCAACHMPMAERSAAFSGDPVGIFGEGFINPENELHTIALDGVSCTLCHQITAAGLGLPGSYSGGFTIDTELPKGDRRIYGPYSMSQADVDVMQSISGFLPLQGLHLSRAALCATCHTLYTPYVDGSGSIVGEFPEQMTFLEWYYSGYRNISSCQACHMPEAVGGVRISTTSATLRGPFSQHAFVGGNAYVLEILKTFPEELEVTASSQDFAGSIARTLDQLQNEAASMTLDDVNFYNGTLYVDLSIENLAGHKFPTAFPSRRAWLHFMVQDANGATIFESGAYNTNGSIVGNDNDADPLAFEPHYEIIGTEDKVQIYEAILGDTERQVTTTLLRASSYVKDNRLLAWRSEKTAPWEDIAVWGDAFDDEDFQGGGDSIQYIVGLGDAPGPYTITAELLYQSIGFRWAENMRDIQAEEIDRFLRYYDTVPNLPVVVASITTTTED